VVQAKAPERLIENGIPAKVSRSWPIGRLFALSALLRLPQAHPGAAAVFRYELSATRLKRFLNSATCLIRYARSCLGLDPFYRW
jgi:hypothetical protein